MHCVRKVSDDIYWIGANDKRLQLFENIHPLTDGVSYTPMYCWMKKPYFSIRQTGLWAGSS